MFVNNSIYVTIFVFMVFSLRGYIYTALVAFPNLLGYLFVTLNSWAKFVALFCHPIKLCEPNNDRVLKPSSYQYPDDNILK
jgi:hypothetical protein